MISYRVRHFENDETINFLKNAVRASSSVPFIGTGFTGGERASGSTVPMGKAWLAIMKQDILLHAKGGSPSAKDLEEMSFNDVSDLYFSWPIVPISDIKKRLGDNFFQVDIVSNVKQTFLHFPWPYVYTLNLDDAIERAINGIKVLPYKKSGRHPDRRYVYKLHGDVVDLLAASSHQELSAIFGTKQYIESLHRNESMLADLANDLAEKNLIFIGCSLTNELDLLFAISKIESKSEPAKGLRILICGEEPVKFSEQKKLNDYGITDVIVVSNYQSFYAFIGDLAHDQEDLSNPLSQFAFKEPPKSAPTIKQRIQYMLQANWKGDTFKYSEVRDCEERFLSKIGSQPLVAVWGRRFSGKTTLLQRGLNRSRDRKRFFVPSSASVSDRLLNQILQAKDSLVAIDSGALLPAQLRRLALSSSRLETNRTCVALALPRADLNTLGRDFDFEHAVENVDFRFSFNESKAIDLVLDPHGYQKWASHKTILDNVFTIAESDITARLIGSDTPLLGRVADYARRWKFDGLGRLQFMALYYLAVRQRMYSKTLRVLAKAEGAQYMAPALLESMARDWLPFVEAEEPDSSSRVAENSGEMVASNSFAWLRVLLTKISEKAGHKASAQMISDLYLAVHDVDSDPFDLILYDNLNSIYETRASNQTDWSGALIRQVYEGVASKLAQDPDYWLQRAKAVYYISNDAADLRIAAAYCEKGLKERHHKSWSNAQLTRANILGKACLLEGYSVDENISQALRAYVDVIEDAHLNPAYIDELLKKSKGGRHYMSKLCDAAAKRVSMLKERDAVGVLLRYLT